MSKAPDTEHTPPVILPPVRQHQEIVRIVCLSTSPAV